MPRPGDNPGLVRDCSLLLAARDALASDGSLNWSAGLLMSSWQGVTVNSPPSMRVQRLLLTDAGLTGSIPAALGGLDDLRRLDLDDNTLTGEIPSELGRLSKLDQLYLFDNLLSGGIPSALGSLTNLRHLFLYGNRLTGEIPSELAGQSALADLYLEGNSFSGCIPSGLQDVENNDLDLLGLDYCSSPES